MALKVTRRNFFNRVSAVTLSLSIGQLFGQSFSYTFSSDNPTSNKPFSSQIEKDFYALSCFLTGFETLDLKMNAAVLNEILIDFPKEKAAAILRHFREGDKKAFANSADPELRSFRKKILTTWFTGQFTPRKQSKADLVTLGYLGNLTWASYTVPAPGIPFPNWDKPLLNFESST